MAERINKFYKPAELEAAIEAIKLLDFESMTAGQLIVALHKAGWRLVKVPE